MKEKNTAMIPAFRIVIMPAFAFILTNGFQDARSPVAISRGRALRVTVDILHKAVVAIRDTRENGKDSYGCLTR